MLSELGWLADVGMVASAGVVGYLAWMGFRARAELRRRALQVHALQLTADAGARERDRLVEQLEQLTASARRLAGTVEPQTAYQTIVRQFAELASSGTSSPRASLWLYDPAQDGFLLETAVPEAREWLAANRLSLKEDPMAAVAGERRPLTLTTLAPSLQRLSDKPFAASDGAVIIPLTVDDQLLAMVLMLCSPAHLEAFQRHILEATLFTAEASLAVWNMVQREFAMVDHLTRVYNYAYFKERLGQELERCYRFELPLSLLLIDTDEFKAINDTAGHQAGDRALIMVAQTIQHAVRTMDLVARYGGDEFILMLPELGPGASPDTCAALPVAQRIRQAVARQRLELADRTLALTVSIGIGIRERNAPRSVNAAALFKQADEQLYRAKRAGKNRCAFPGGPLIGPD